MTFIKRNVMFAILYAAFCFNANATDSGANKATPEVPVAVKFSLSYLQHLPLKATLCLSKTIENGLRMRKVTIKK
ncbi:hypothetical protein MTsDn1_31310 [Alteromonas sp. MTD1]